MRDLTREECEFIAGGKLTRQLSASYNPETPPDVVVTASPPPPPYYPPPSPPPYLSPSPPGGGTGGGGGGSSGPSEVYPAGWDYQRDYNIDKMASDMISQIKSKPNVNTTEWSGFIYKTADGKLHESNILEGGLYNTDNGYKTVADFGVPNGATLVADIHSHPGTYWMGQDFEPNANSLNADYGDMAANYNYSHTAGADSQYRSYTYHDYDGSTAEFDAAQNQTLHSGPATSVDPYAVQGGYHPDRGV